MGTITNIMPQPGRRSKNQNAGNTPRNNNHPRVSKNVRTGRNNNTQNNTTRGGINARRRSTFHGYTKPSKDLSELIASVGKNMEIVVGWVYLMIVLIIIGWLQFACSWYTARCSEFVARAASTNVSLPEGWSKYEYKGCDKVTADINSTADTLIYFGLNSFAHLDKAETAYVYATFPLGAKANYFWNFGPLLWLLVVINFLGMMTATVYWSMKSMSMSMMYTSKGMRAMFGPGNGFFAALGFSLSMVMYIDYRHGVKAIGKTHILVLESLGYGSNFSLFMLVIIMYAVAIASSITLFTPDEVKLKNGKEAGKSFKMAVKRVSTVSRMSKSGGGGGGGSSSSSPRSRMGGNQGSKNQGGTSAKYQMNGKFIG